MIGRYRLIWLLGTLVADMRQIAKTMRNDSDPEVVIHSKELMGAADIAQNWVDAIVKKQDDELASKAPVVNSDDDNTIKKLET